MANRCLLDAYGFCRYTPHVSSVTSTGHDAYVAYAHGTQGERERKRDSVMLQRKEGGGGVSRYSIGQKSIQGRGQRGRMGGGAGGGGGGLCASVCIFHESITNAPADISLARGSQLAPHVFT